MFAEELGASKDDATANLMEKMHLDRDGAGKRQPFTGKNDISGFHIKCVPSASRLPHAAPQKILISPCAGVPTGPSCP